MAGQTTRSTKGKRSLLTAALQCAFVLVVADDQWSVDRARTWHAAQPWRVGANYLPSTCGNVLEMFDPATFDATLLVAEKELQVARSIGFSTMRVFLHEELFHQQGQLFLDNVDRLLGVFSRCEMAVMLVLFDAVWRPDVEDVEILPGVHNSAWVQCPSHSVLRSYSGDDPGAHQRLERYVKTVVARFSSDSRVVVWDIYNEASMTQSEHWLLPRLMAMNRWEDAPAHWLMDEVKQAATLRLLLDAFAWARSVKPEQPLTSGIWTFPESFESADPTAVFFRVLVGLSDIISIHCYCAPEELEARLEQLAPLGRPIMVTEFMARTLNSTFPTSLPVLERHAAWSYSWGLFRGRSQTHLPWSTWIGEPVKEEDPWFHDLLFDNGTAYDAEEVKAVWWHTIGRALRV